MKSANLIRSFVGGLLALLAKGEAMARRLPALKPKKVIKALERGGFYTDHVTGSHYIMMKGGEG